MENNLKNKMCVYIHTYIHILIYIYINKYIHKTEYFAVHHKLTQHYKSTIPQQKMCVCVC